MLRLQTTFHGVSVLLASTLLAFSAYGQAKDCCSVSQQQWYTPASPEACRAAGDIHAGDMATMGSDMTKIMALQACSRGAMQQAQDAYGGQIPGLPGGLPGMTPGGQIPSLPGTSTPVNSEPQFLCCNISAGEFIGEMSEQACREEGSSFYPDTPENLDKTNVCHAQTAGGGGGSWNVEDYEDNIENGGMEIWADDRRPVDYTTYGVNPNIPRSYPLDIQVAERSSDAHTGQWSIKVKNVDILPQLPPEASMALAIAGPDTFVLPGGIMTCEEPCPTETGADMTHATPEIFNSLEADDVTSFVCGAYKGYIGSTDQLVIAVNIDGGGNGFAAGVQKSFTRSSSNWIEFTIPLNAYPGGGVPDQRAKVGINARLMQRGSTMQWGSNRFTEVWLDSFHFCDPTMMTAYAPEVVAGNTTTKIADHEEDTLGVQTFVNLDNDDEDGEYDHKDTDGVAGDNELVRLRLELPMKSFGKVEFKADKVGDTIQLWDDAGKKNKFELYNDEVEVEELLRANANGSKFIRDIWVEALKPSASPKDQVFTFNFKNRLNNDELTEDKIVMTALALESIEWVGQKKPDGGIEIFQLDPLAPSWAKRPVKRVFPGKQWVDHKPEDSPRDIVKMRANLNVKPVRPVNVYFRQIDVDDPSTNDDEVDLEDSAEDNRSEKDDWGFTGPTHEYAEVEFDNIEKEVDFRVPMQPGDNFLIVGGGDLESLKRLENDDQKLAIEDEALGFLVHDPDVLDSKGDPAEAEIPRAEQSTSEVVTTWRKLHLEIDKMEAVKNNRVKGKFVSFRHRGTREIGDREWFITDVKINKTLYLELPEEARTGEAGLVNSFANGGRLKIGGWGADAQVIENTAQPGGFDVITIATPAQRDFGTQDENQPIELWDDDQFTNDGDTWPDLNFDLLEEEMKKVYIEVDKTTVDNPRKTQPFLINAGGDEPYYLKSLFRKSIDNVDYSDDPDFWYAFILDAFQGSLFEDGDGTFGGAIAGQTDANNAGKGGRGAVFYYESGRELARDNPSVGYSRDASVVHEVGHLFGGIHAHPGVMLYTTNAIGQANMTPRSQRYAPITQDAIRSTINP